MVLSHAEQLHLAMQPAFGLAYLSSRGILHLDVAARNCLVGKGNVVKVADFGMAQRLAPDKSTWTPAAPLKIPIKWSSLEALQAQQFSQASDVWSYGVLAWEVLSLGTVPYSGVHNQLVLPKLLAGERLSKPDNAFPALYQICLQCWHPEPKSRPKFQKIAQHLRDQLNGLPSDQLKHIRDLGATLATRGGSTASLPAGMARAAPHQRRTSQPQQQQQEQRRKEQKRTQQQLHLLQQAHAQGTEQS